jgi:hypothetical protein
MPRYAKIVRHKPANLRGTIELLRSRFGLRWIGKSSIERCFRSSSRAVSTGASSGCETKYPVPRRSPSAAQAIAASPFRHRWRPLSAKLLCKRNNPLKDRLCTVIVECVANEGAVYLQGIERKGLPPRKTAVADTEIVDGDRDACPLKAFQNKLRVLGVVCDRGFGNLDPTLALFARWRASAAHSASAKSNARADMASDRGVASRIVAQVVARLPWRAGSRSSGRGEAPKYVRRSPTRPAFLRPAANA